MDVTTEQSDPVVEARRKAGRELARWRANANLTQAQLADRVNYSRAQVAGAERGWQRTAVAFWQRCDAALGADGALLAAYARLEATRQAKREREAHRAEAAREAKLERRRTQHGLGGLRTSATAAPDARFTRPLAAANIRPRRLDPGVINEFEAMTASYRRLYHRTAAEDVLDSLTEHVAGMERLLRQSRDTNNQQRPLWQRLAATGGEAALLAGRLRHFDLNQPDAARSDYQEAFHAARAADDPMLAASALGHASFIPTGDGDTATALRLLDDAHGLAEASGNPTIRAWVFAIQARTHAIAGSAGRTLTAIETAERILQTAADPASNPEWLDYFDRGRLGAFKGYCYLRLHRPADALTVLDEALEALDAAAYKARACYLADIATASVQRGQLEQGCSIAGQAADLLVQTGYWIGLDRISQFRAQLADRKDTAPVRWFEDRLWELGLFWTDAQ